MRNVMRRWLLTVSVQARGPPKPSQCEGKPSQGAELARSQCDVRLLAIAAETRLDSDESQFTQQLPLLLLLSSSLDAISGPASFCHVG